MSLVCSADINSNESIEKMSSLISKYGIATVVLAVFLVVVISVFIYVIKTNNDNNKAYKEQQKAILDKFQEQQDNMLNTITQLLKEGNTSNSKKVLVVREDNFLKRFLKFNGSIKNIIKEMADEISSDRIGVYVFHNGSNTSTGVPFYRMSCINEIMKKNSGVKSGMVTHKDLSLALFDTGLAHLYKDGSYVLKTSNATDVDNNPLLCSMLKDNSIETGIGVLIYDSVNEPSGILLIEFKKNTTDEEYKKIIDVAINKAQILSPILEIANDDVDDDKTDK